MSDNFLSRVEEILTAMINSDEYSQVPQSRVEALLLELKDVIEEGGGGKGPFYPAGNIDYDDIPAPSAETLGAMYNVNDAFVTTNEFVEGAGVKYPAGTNVAVVNVGTVDDPLYMFDAYAGAYITDDVLSGVSENPVQNRIVKAALDGKATSVDLSALAAIVSNKADSADIPTKTSDLTNDSDFTTVTYVDQQIATRQKKVVNLTYAEYQALATKDPEVIYLVDGVPAESIIDDTTASVSTTYSSNKINSELSDKVNITIYTAGQAKQNAIANHTYEGEALTDLFATEIQSDYDNAWQWLAARNKSGNWNGMNVADFIPFTTTNGVTLNAQIAGINTYKNYGDSAVGNHIDFICKEIWPTLHPVNKVNYNNGTADQNHAWLASDAYLYINSLAGNVPNGTGLNPETVAVDYTADGIYYYLPQQLKNVIVEKRFLLPKRYSASGLLSDDNAWAWVNIGKLWFPDEVEVYGLPVWGGKGGYSLGGSGLQYPIFAGNMNRLKYRNGSRYNWWLLSPYEGNSSTWCFVNSVGYCDYYYASGAGIGCPVCFRVGTEYAA